MENCKELLTDDIIKSFDSLKANIVRYIKKNFKLNIDYKIVSEEKISGKFPKKDYYLTNETMKLLIGSYKLRQLSLFKKSLTHPVIISIEAATIGFIYEVFKDLNLKKQYKVSNYFIDLYFIDYKIAIECDEDQHLNLSNKINDENRQKFIQKKLNCIFYRYKPNEDNFSLAKVIKDLRLLIKN